MKTRYLVSLIGLTSALEAQTAPPATTARTTTIAAQTAAQNRERLIGSNVARGESARKILPGRIQITVAEIAASKG